ncbi:Metallo-dependent phosphatase [Xylona heveae TC161]|uniref:Metallo-dependent phosphatase n=1 Tax=Xylona heveae (strain CBS 132557 / TC161) TaxID=1328760 RepID=A0A161TBD6_XYLHT|nr:Metallo-dependent phosphatase [Xylona heveae TC161]KZF22987.1 Metallo-dependent phosphatase [Xylona heveae TC161]
MAHYEHQRSPQPRDSPFPTPLINQVRNEWQTNPKYGQINALSVDEEPRWIEMIKAPRLRRHVFMLVAVLIACWLTWRFWLVPRLAEQDELLKEFNTNHEEDEQYGANALPQFTDVIHMQELDSRLLPRAGSSGDSRRLVIVGDVHGCKEELVELLNKVSFKQATDHLILTGDIVAKGPDTPGVVQLARDFKASCVRGNHEDRLLLTYNAMRSGRIALKGPEEDPNTEVDDMDEESFNKGDYKYRALVKQLSKEQITYLKSCPVILRIGQLSGMGEVVVVHAGLLAGVPLLRQDPFNVMHMRTVDLETHVPSAGREGTPWEKLWNKHQAKASKKSRTTVVYGHDAKRGLNIQQYSKGLDSACVTGGQLTALVIEPGSWGSVTQTLVHVDCHNRKNKKTKSKNVKIEDILPTGD